MEGNRARIRSWQPPPKLFTVDPTRSGPGPPGLAQSPPGRLDPPTWEEPVDRGECAGGGTMGGHTGECAGGGTIGEHTGECAGGTLPPITPCTASHGRRRRTL